MVNELGNYLSIDRMNIGLIDNKAYTFQDVFVKGTNVPGREIGHTRTLNKTVVEASLEKGGSIIIGNEKPSDLIKTFPNLKSTLDTGIQSMLVVTLESSTDLIGAIVIASFKSSAYTEHDIGLVKKLSSKIIGRVIILKKGGQI